MKGFVSDFPLESEVGRESVVASVWGAHLGSHNPSEVKLAYVLEENRVLREHLKGRQLRLTDKQRRRRRRRLGRKGRLLSRSELGRLAKIATPETILGWYRKLVACKYDGSKKRWVGRLSTGLTSSRW